MGKTIAEKILSSHSGQDLKAGDFAICDVDYCFGQDGTSMIIIDRIRQWGIEDLAMKDKFSMVIDHSAPSPNMGVSAVHKKMRDFAKEYGVKLFEIGDGVCHIVIPESGYVLPGDLVLGADSHTCSYGALCAFSSGVGSTDLAVTLASGKNWFRVPETIKITIKGKLPEGVVAKDLILFIIRNLTVNGATYKAVEFYGEVIDNLDMDARFTVANMGVEMGAKAVFLPFNDVVKKFLSGRTDREIVPIYADEDAVYCQELEFDVSNLSPQIACPHAVDNVVDIEEIEGMPVDQVYIGTCTNGRYSDLKMAAEILKGKKVSPSLRLIVAPGSREIMLRAMQDGILSVFVESGAAVVTPGCGPCVGTHNGVPSDGEKVLSTANRNFKGRMGNPSAYIYLASPLVAAATAIEGRIADPRRYVT